MLVPGEYVLKPSAAPPDVSSPTPLATPVLSLAVGCPDEATQAARSATPTAKAEQPEPRSFLLTLLRALGAVHS